MSQFLVLSLFFGDLELGLQLLGVLPQLLDFCSLLDQFGRFARQQLLVLQTLFPLTSELIRKLIFGLLEFFLKVYQIKKLGQVRPHPSLLLEHVLQLIQSRKQVYLKIHITFKLVTNQANHPTTAPLPIRLHHGTHSESSNSLSSFSSRSSLDETRQGGGEKGGRMESELVGVGYGEGFQIKGFWLNIYLLKAATVLTCSGCAQCSSVSLSAYFLKSSLLSHFAYSFEIRRSKGHSATHLQYPLIHSLKGFKAFSQTFPAFDSLLQSACERHALRERRAESRLPYSLSLS